jgi:hypothetical protein
MTADSRALVTETLADSEHESRAPSGGGVRTAQQTRRRPNVYARTADSRQVGRTRQRPGRMRTKAPVHTNVNPFYVEELHHAKLQVGVSVEVSQG